MHINLCAEFIQTKTSFSLYDPKQLSTLNRAATVSLQDLIQSLSPTKAVKEYFVCV